MDASWQPGRWGAQHESESLDARTRVFAQQVLGDPQVAPRPTIQPVRASRLSHADLERLFTGVAGSVDDSERARYSRGMSYLDFLAWRSGEVLDAPDAVMFPDDHDQVLSILQTCSREGVVVVPIGGGTSVTGAITHDGWEARSIAISTRQLNRIFDIDGVSGIAHVGSGVTGPQVESHLAETGWTLGHFPQSWERASIGGFIAARSSGQSSSGYGRIEDMLLGARVATPVGTWDVGGFPAASSGPDLRHLILGSEGTLGVVTSAQLRLRPRSTIREYAAAVIPGEFEQAVEAMRHLAQSSMRPTVVRASDTAETDALLTMSMPRGALGKAFSAYLKIRSALPGSLLILGWEGTGASDVAAARAHAREVLAGAVWLGDRPGRSWERGRFRGPYLRDALMDEGYLVETFETVTRWSNVVSLHQAVQQAARRALGERSYVMAHISHSYDTGASLYFTVLAGGWSDPIESASRWREAKVHITNAIVAGGGAVSHHHGVGRDHRAWLPEQVGAIGMDVLQSVKTALDPGGIMNPGALL